MDESYLSWLRLIPGVSSDLAKRIAERYPDPELLKGASPADLSSVPGMTGEVAARVLDLVRAASTADASWYREEPSLYLCPECGSFVGKGSNACPFCGVVFDEGESVSESPVEELLRARNGEAKICTRCGAFLEPGATACGMCGSEYPAERLGELPAVDTTPIPEADLFLCPHCGAFLGPGDAACAICGTPVDSEKRIPGLAREGKGVSKDFLSRWERVASEDTLTPPAPPAPRSLEDELREYERLLEADPSLGRAWLHKGRILVQLGRSSEAVACFDRAARIDPENEDEYRRELLGLLGLAAEASILPPRWREMEREPVVRDLFDELEERPREQPTTSPTVPEPSLVAAKPEEPVTPATPAPKAPAEAKPIPAVEPSPAPVSAELPAIRRAIAYYDRLLAMDSGLRVAWQTKGELLQRLGRKEEAERAFQRAADLEVAEREFGRTALTGLQTRAPVRAAAPRGTVPAGRTNGRVNGLTNGRRGRTNGRVNGLTNGSGAANGLTNGLGRVNGLVSGLARGEGRTNGLVNGNGFTNGRRGRPPVRMPSAGRDWARSVAGIAGVILLMVLAPILVSVLTTPTVNQGIVIDGRFGDWNRVLVSYADPVGDTRGNPDVDLTLYKIDASPIGINVYARVNGTAFRGVGNGADIVVALIDSDGNPNTGYDPGRIGAEYAVEIVGWDYGVRDTHLLAWRGGSSPTDWSGFQPAGTALAAAAGSEVEFSAALDNVKSNARVLVAAVDGAGRHDLADAIVIPGAAALSVKEKTVGPDVITTAAGVGVLRLDLTPEGLPVVVTALNVTKRGSLADSAVSLSLYQDNGDGVFTGADTPLGTSAVVLGRASFPLSTTLDRAATWFVAADFSALPVNETFGLALRNVETLSPVTLASTDVTLSYLATAPQPTIDGAFGDWASVPRTADPLGDVVNRTDVSAVVNGNVDLTEVASFLATNASFYLRVDGTILGGMEVPNLRARTPPQAATDSDLDSVPDNVEANLGPGLAADFNNDNVTDANSVLPDGRPDVDRDGVADYPSGPDMWLNTTIPAWYPAPYAGRAVSRYIGPISQTPEPGVDTAFVYIDRDNRSDTGLFTYVDGVPHGMDFVYQAVGRQGTILESALYAYNASLAIPWTKVADAPAAVDGHRLEAAFNASLVNLSADHKFVFMTSDWRYSSDTVSPATRSRNAPAPGTRAAGDPPRTMDIFGNLKFYLRDQNHATETACTTNKVATTTQGAGPAASITLSAGQSACWYADSTAGMTIPAGDWEALLDVFVAHGLVVYGENGATVPRAREWTGAAFSAQTSGPAVPGTEQWVVVASSPTSPEKIVAILSSDNRLYVQTWTGAAWTANWNVALGASDTRKFDVAYEGGSGDALVVFGDATNQLKFRRRLAGTWDAADQTAGTSLGAVPRWVRTVSRPTNDDVFVGALTNAQTLHAFRWDGAGNTMGSQVQMSQNTLTSTQEPFDIAFDRASGNAFVIWGTNGATLRYRTFTAAWQAEAVAYTLPSSARWVVADYDPRPTASGIAVGMILDSTNYEFGAWNGASWVTRPAALAARTRNHRGIDVAFERSTGRAMFAFDWNNFPSQLSWRTWTAAGGFGAATAEPGTSGNLRFIQLRSNPVRNEIIALYSDSNSDLFHRYWSGTTWTPRGTALETSLSVSNRREPFMFAWTRVVEYDVVFEIWNLVTHAVVQTIGSCLDRRTYGDDVQCLVPGVPQITLAPNQVVRLRISHSSAGGLVTVVFDDVATTGNSRLTIPIPEFETVLVPIAAIIVLVGVRRARRRKRE